MTTKWANNPAGEKPDFSELFKEQYAVVLMRGKNSFGDHIYSYIKITFANFKRMYEEMEAKKQFTPSDYGEVVAAGTGEPTDEVKAEIAAQYPMLDQKPASSSSSGSGGSAAAPVAKKAWDEY
ncbi:MAG: hypothetical protein SFX19_06780 [Alphaproteobacteria bacterium]|nr:hypothetical protein [Alphaproteobacteria bacterium]